MYPPLHFLPLTGYWYPENFLLASAYYYWSIFRVKIFQKAMSLRFSLFSSQVIILYDENQRMDLVQGKLKIAVQLPEYFGIYPSWEEALQQDLTKKHTWVLLSSKFRRSNVSLVSHGDKMSHFCYFKPNRCDLLRLVKKLCDNWQFMSAALKIRLFSEFSTNIM